MIEAKIIADSLSPDGARITTLQVTFPRFILPEFNTHRVFSRNFSSSRAIPTKKLIEQIKSNPAMPVHWGKNQPGMQAKEELDPLTTRSAKALWLEAARQAASAAEILAQLGAHKQIVNRLIEPYLWVTGIVTSTEWENWDSLRRHEDAQPEIYELACRVKEAMDASNPIHLQYKEWHLPYILEHEKQDPKLSTLLLKISAARCCRVSYLKHDGLSPSIEEDLALFDRLAAAVPIHASPLEHQATPDCMCNGNWGNPHVHGNFDGWMQFRKLWEYNLPCAKAPIK